MSPNKVNNKLDILGIWYNVQERRLHWYRHVTSVEHVSHIKNCWAFEVDGACENRKVRKIWNELMKPEPKKHKGEDKELWQVTIYNTWENPSAHVSMAKQTLKKVWVTDDEVHNISIYAYYVHVKHLSAAVPSLHYALIYPSYSPHCWGNKVTMD